MEYNQFGSGFEILWSVVAIAGGIVLIGFRKWFTDSNSRAFSKLFKATRFQMFKSQSQEMNKPYMGILVPILGIVFLIVGLITLINNL